MDAAFSKLCGRQGSTGAALLFTDGHESAGRQVLVDDPKELEKIRERESDITKERIQKVLDAGANVVLTTKGIDDMSLKYFVEAGVIACRRVPKEDLRCDPDPLPCKSSVSLRQRRVATLERANCLRSCTSRHERMC
jgi:hypothetical protein